MEARRRASSREPPVSITDLYAVMRLIYGVEVLVGVFLLFDSNSSALGLGTCLYFRFFDIESNECSTTIEESMWEESKMKRAKDEIRAW